MMMHEPIDKFVYGVVLGLALTVTLSGCSGIMKEGLEKMGMDEAAAVIDGVSLTSDNPEDWLPVTSGEQFAYIDDLGGYAIPPKEGGYANVFSDGLAAVGRADLAQRKVVHSDKYNVDVIASDKVAFGYIDKTGTMVIEPKYTTANAFKDGRVTVGIDTPEGKKYGMIDKSGNYIIQPEYESLNKEFHEGLIIAVKNGKHGALDESGNVAIPFEHPIMYDFHDGMSLVLDTEKKLYGYMDKTGKMVIEPQYKLALDFYEGVAPAQKSDPENPEHFTGVTGLIDKSGEWVVEPKFQTIQAFSKGLAPAMPKTDNLIKRKWGYINTKGEWVIEPQYEQAGTFDDKDYAIVKKIEKKEFGDDGKLKKVHYKYGWVSNNGQVTVAPTFDDMKWEESFKEDLVMVKVGEHWGYTNLNGEVVIEPKFIDAKPFKGEVTQAWLPGEDPVFAPLVLVNKEGKYVRGPVNKQAGQTGPLKLF